MATAIINVGIGPADLGLRLNSDIPESKGHERFEPEAVFS
jgi:hypothetical protein